MTIHVARRVGAHPIGWLGLRSNPLRRRSDLIEASVRIAAVVLCLMAVPLAVGVGMAVRTQVAAVAAQQASTRVAHTATILDKPAVLAIPASGDLPRARVSWSMPSGLRRTATVDVPPDAHPGDTLAVWTTRDGRATVAPLRPDASGADGVLAAAGFELAVIAGAWLCVALGNLLLDRHRYRCWEAEWTALSTTLRH